MAYRFKCELDFMYASTFYSIANISFQKSFRERWKLWLDNCHFFLALCWGNAQPDLQVANIIKISILMPLINECRAIFLKSDKKIDSNAKIA